MANGIGVKAFEPRSDNHRMSEYYMLNHRLEDSCKAVATARAEQHAAEASLEAARTKVYEAIEHQNELVRQHYENMTGALQEKEIPKLSKEERSPACDLLDKDQTISTSHPSNVEACFCGPDSKLEADLRVSCNQKLQHLAASPMAEVGSSLPLPTSRPIFCETCGVPATNEHLCSSSHVLNEWWAKTGEANLPVLASTSASEAQKSMEERGASERSEPAARSQKHWNPVEDLQSARWSAEFDPEVGAYHYNTAGRRSEKDMQNTKNLEDEWHTV